MFQNDLLDLAIGLVFVWFILSLVVSVVNEGFVLVFRIRAKHLWLGIGRLVNPRDGRYARRLWETVVSLPLGLQELDLRPRARPESSDTPLINSGSRNPTRGESSPAAGGTSASTDPLAQRTPQQIATDQRVLLQRVYNALAPYVTDVATERRKSKLTNDQRCGLRRGHREAGRSRAPRRSRRSRQVPSLDEGPTGRLG